MHLAFGQHRVQEVPEVVGDGVFHHLRDAGLGVDLHLGHVSAVRIGPPRQLRPLVPGQEIVAPLGARHLGHLDHRGRQVRSLGAEALVVEGDLARVHARLVRHEGAEGRDDVAHRLQRHVVLNRRRARAARAPAPRDQVAVALHDADALHRDAGLVAEELRVDRFVPLPVRLRADVKADAPILLEDDLRALRRVAQDRFDVVAEPEAAQLAALRALRLPRREARPVAFRLDPREHPVEIAHVIKLARGAAVGEGVGGDEVLPPELPGVHAKDTRRVVHRPLEREDRLGPPRAPIGIDRRGVGEDPLHVEPRRLAVVDPHQHLGEEARLDVLGIARIVGAQVRHVPHPVGQEPVIGVEGKLRLAHEVAARVVRQHRLGPVRHPAHRPAELHGRR